MSQHGQKVEAAAVVATASVKLQKEIETDLLKTKAEEASSGSKKMKELLDGKARSIAKGGKKDE